jgi:hypothetical protein
VTRVAVTGGSGFIAGWCIALRLGDDAASVPSATLTDDEFRSVAQAAPQLAGLLPLLG